MKEWRGYAADQLRCVDCQQQYVQSRVTLARISTLYFPHMWCASQIRLNIYYGRFTRFNNTTAAKVMRCCRVMFFICEVCHMMYPCNVVYLRICYQFLAVLCDFLSISARVARQHYNDVRMGAMASQITSLTIVYSTVYSRRRSKKTLKLRGTGLCGGNSPVAGEFAAQRASKAEMFPFDDVITVTQILVQLIVTSPQPIALKCIQWPHSYALRYVRTVISYPDSKVHGAYMGPSGADRAHVGPMLAPWTLLSGYLPHITLMPMSASVYQITNNFILCSTGCSILNRTIQQSGDRCIPLTQGQWYGNNFHITTSSWATCVLACVSPLYVVTDTSRAGLPIKKVLSCTAYCNYCRNPQLLVYNGG